MPLCVSSRALRAAVTLPLAALGLAACTSNAAPSGTPGADGAAADVTSVTVDSGNDACALSATTAPSGTVTFEVTNSGDDVTEFYLLGSDDRIVGEVENVGPGITRSLVVTAAPGDYVTACKPGMAGDGIRAAFIVTDSGADLTHDDPAAAAAAVDGYVGYVRTEADALLTATQAFATAYLAGDDDAARAAYAPARSHWERIEPAAESFGDLDPRMDAREADLEPGQEWTGWHVLEKDLWPPAGHAALTETDRERVAGRLVADTTDLHGRVHADDFTLTLDAIGNGAKELLDEVATGKVTGEEEIWSHTDLWDFQANVDGAREAFTQLRDLAEAADADLVATLDARFDAVQVLLDAQRAGDGFRSYTDLTAEEVRALAASVDALGEPLSRLTAAVVL